MTLGTNITEFLAAVNLWEQTVPRRAFVELKEEVALFVLRRARALTPVDTGRAQRGWRVSLDENDVADVVVPLITSELVIAATPPFQDVFVVNNVPYIVQLEEGSSLQAPFGMLAVAIAEAESRFPA